MTLWPVCVIVRNACPPPGAYDSPDAVAAALLHDKAPQMLVLGPLDEVDRPLSQTELGWGASTLGNGI